MRSPARRSAPRLWRQKGSCRSLPMWPGRCPLLPPEVGTVLWAVGYSKAPTSGRGVRIHDVYVGGLANLLRALPPAVERFIYISSTGVYGQVTGGEVDEDSPCQPTREGGQACLAAEELLRESPLADRTIILRLAGLYGPGRIPRSQDLVAGLPIDAPSQGWLNLIHVEDAARIVLLAEQNAQPPKLYVVADGQPVIRGDYYRELSRLLRVPPPRFVDPAGRFACCRPRGERQAGQSAAAVCGTVPCPAVSKLSGGIGSRRRVAQAAANRNRGFREYRGCGRGHRRTPPPIYPRYLRNPQLSTEGFSQARTQSAFMNATRSAFSSAVSFSPSTRLKNSTVSSSVSSRPSCRYGGESLMPRSGNVLIGPSPTAVRPLTFCGL